MFLITETKPVEKSQNSADLYATWYTKYERSACMEGGGAPLIVQQAADADKNTVASAARLPRCIQGSFECDGFPGKREEKMNGADFHHHLQLFAASQMCCTIWCSVFSHISFKNRAGIRTAPSH